MNRPQNPHRRLQTPLILAAILLLGLALRLYGLNWDGGYLFHPDERQIILVVDHLSFPWPPDWSLLLTPESPLNPGFFAYGSLPIYLLRLLASAAGLFNREYATLMSSYQVGRALSALFDVGTVWLVFLMGRRLFDRVVGLIGAGFVAVAVLHIQLSHFYTVDTVLTFFTLWTLYLLVELTERPRLAAAWGIAAVWGLAMATKMSAAPLAIPMIAAWIGGALTRRDETSQGPRGWPLAISGIVLTGLLAIGFFFLFEPYAMIDIVTFAVDVIQESFMASGYADVPYTRQYIGTIPYLFQLRQLVVWSLGLPLGATAVAGTVAMIGRMVMLAWRRQGRRLSLLLAPILWVLVYFGLTGSFHAKFLRYMLPITPLLCLYAAWGFVGFVRWASGYGRLGRMAGLGLAGVVALGALFYTAAFMNVYRQEHPWLRMTAWICEHVPPNKVIMIEHWDDPLPLTQTTGELACADEQLFVEFPAYDRDDTAKLDDLLLMLLNSDYISISSNRLYNTIPRLPERYPLTSRYYELLMAEKLGFELVHYEMLSPEFLGLNLIDDTFRDPELPQPRLYREQESKLVSLHLGRADESFTVYDHPKPLFFQKTRTLSLDALRALFADVAADLPAPEPEEDAP